MKIILDDLNEYLLMDYVDLNKEDALYVLKMRNHDSIKEWMFSQEDISLEDHLAFIDGLRQDKSKQYFLVKRQGCNIGTINFSKIDRKRRTAEFGVYSNPYEKLRGTGRILEQISEKYAFDSLKLGALYLEVFCRNDRAISLYRKSGYQVIDTRQVNDEDIFCMEKINPKLDSE